MKGCIGKLEGPDVVYEAVAVHFVPEFYRMATHTIFEGLTKRLVELLEDSLCKLLAYISRCHHLIQHISKGETKCRLPVNRHRVNENVPLRMDLSLFSVLSPSPRAFVPNLTDIADTVKSHPLYDKGTIHGVITYPSLVWQWTDWKNPRSVLYFLSLNFIFYLIVIGIHPNTSVWITSNT